MSDEGMTLETERRLERALDRLETVIAGPGSTAALQEALEAEKAASAQLSDRIRTLKIELAEKEQAAAMAQPALPLSVPEPFVEAPVEDLSGVVAERDAELRELRGQLDQAMMDLRDVAAAKDAELEQMRADMAGAEAGFAETLAAKDAEIAGLRDAAAAPVAQAADPGDLAALNDLAEITAEVRAKAAQGCVDAELINGTMLAELEAMRITRQADLAEMRALLAELEPMLEETAHA